MKRARARSGVLGALPRSKLDNMNQYCQVCSVSAEEVLIPERGRRAQILNSALGVFLRFGFRKTSMDDLARALDLSRQALYSYFRSKDELFRATLEYAFVVSLRDGAARLAEENMPLTERVARAYDEAVGRYIGLGSDLADLHEATQRLGADVMQHADDEFRALIVAAIQRDGLPAVYRERGVSAEDFARTINTLARGTKHGVHSREEFGKLFREQLAVLFVPFDRRLD